jgi:hypothetical protein
VGPVRRYMSFVGEALGSGRGWALGLGPATGPVGRAFRYLPAATCGEKASWVACRHVELEMRIAGATRVLSGCTRGADAPPLSSRRAPRRVTASATPEGLTAR